MGTFDKRMKEIGERVGDGNLTGRVVFNQVYAQRQHEALHYRHPAGGQAKYLYNALMAGYIPALRDIARVALTGGIVGGMIKGTEDIARDAADRAPFEFADLRNSAHPLVTDGGARVYSRPPIQRRLNKAQHRTKQRLRYLGLGNRENRWNEGDR